MAPNRHAAITRNSLRYISGRCHGATRRNFAASSARAQDDRTIAQSNSNYSGPNSRNRLTDSKLQQLRGYGLGLPPNPNNLRGRDGEWQQQRHENHRPADLGEPSTQSQKHGLEKQVSPNDPSVRGDLSTYINLPGEGQSPKARRRRARRELETGSRDNEPTAVEKSITSSASATQSSPVNQVGTFLDGQPVYFSPISLRDLCTCPSCLDPSTKQKLFSTADIPQNIRTSAVAQDAESISLVWENDIPGLEEGHTTVLNIDTLRALRDSDGAPSAASHYQAEKQVIWDASQYQQLGDFEYEDYMQDDATLFRALQQLHTYGMLFLQNVPGHENSVSTIAERIGPVKNTFYGYTWDVRSVPQAKNVAYTSQDLGFHMDLLYMHQPPHLQFLHCIRSSAAGGASVFADAYKAAADLFSEDIEAFLELATLPATFHYNHLQSHLYQQSHTTIKISDFDDRFTSFTDFAQSYRRLLRGRSNYARAKDAARAFQNRELKIEDYIANVAWSPPFQAPFQFPYHDDNSGHTRPSAFNNRISRWHAAAQKFNRLIHRNDTMYERMMKPGECVIFDNRRVLHARKAFEVGDLGKERWLRGAYLDWDPYWSKMRVLGRKFGRRELVQGKGEMGGSREVRQ